MRGWIVFLWAAIATIVLGTDRVAPSPTATK